MQKHQEIIEDLKCFIIASDHDYLQLISDRVKLYDLKYKDVSTSKSAFEDPVKNLFYKIVLGDKSDNIKPVFQGKKVGPKTIEKYYESRKLFMMALQENSTFQETYDFNNQLINMTFIPAELQYAFYRKYN